MIPLTPAAAGQRVLESEQRRADRDLDVIRPLGKLLCHASGNQRDLEIARERCRGKGVVYGVRFAAASPGGRTIINGEDVNVSFGEEILGGFDVDDDGLADLFAGDLIADGTAAQNRPTSGLGHLFHHAAALKGLEFDLQLPPPGLVVTRILGPENGAIGADTAAVGDFDGDGVDDIVFASPHANPLGRNNAGAAHVIYGKPGGWPALIDLAPAQLPPPEVVRVAMIQGARGDGGGGDTGDTLGYSAAAGDVDGDGLSDLIINEMVGNGLSPGTIDVGNLIVVGGRALRGKQIFTDGFESGDTGAWSGPRR